MRSRYGGTEMMSTATQDRRAAPADRRWLVLVVVAVAQLMVVLDATVVNIALPSAQHALGFSNNDRQWVVTAYALAFGSLLLLGGRLSDLFGRKIAFVVGLIGFAVASVLGGLAPGFGLLVAARALQGAFGAVLAPAALSLLTTTFPAGRDRARAFGVFSALAGSGAAIGLLLGGTLTEYFDWRWCMYVNVVFAVIAMVGALILLPAHPSERRPHLDLWGTLTASGGLFCIVFGFATAETSGWSSWAVYASPGRRCRPARGVRGDPAGGRGAAAAAARPARPPPRRLVPDDPRAHHRHVRNDALPGLRAAGVPRAHAGAHRGRDAADGRLDHVGVDDDAGAAASPGGPEAADLRRPAPRGRRAVLVLVPLPRRPPTPAVCSAR